ncbi:MAG: SH3 domain-containing protein [Caldilineaceae bacterium]|nr:SH3 domain-containing protein [Caldilineaceae bacterium]
MARTTQTIATDYQANRDLATARTALQALEVANVNQWLIYTTESAIDAGEVAATTNALVTLALDLGLQSNVIEGYARANGLHPASINANAETAVVDSALNHSGSADDAQLNAPPSNGNEVAVLVPMPDVANNVAPAVSNEADSPEAAAVQLKPTPAPIDNGQTAAVADAGAAAPDAVEAEEATATPTVEPTATVATQPSVLASTGINVRSGPGVEYEIAGALAAGESAQIAGKNPAADWWEIILPSGRQGWVYSPLVETNGNTDGIAVAVNIPTPPPPTPTSPPPPTAAPVVEEPVAAEPAATTAPEPAPVAEGPTFRAVEKRLWDVVENGGQLNGPSVTCGEKRQLVVRVIDAAGNPLNGVAVQAIYGAQEIFISGDQGKGDGIAEFVLGGGQAVKVIRDSNGNEVTSEEVYNLSTKPWEIPFETLIGGRFCTDEASCQSFVDATGCYGHYSWTVTFQRNY